MLRIVKFAHPLSKGVPAKRVVKALPNAVQRLSTDIKRNPDEKDSAKPKAEPPVLEYWERLEICKECPRGSLHINGYPTKCEECGCLIQAKAMFPIFHCPIGKW